MSEPASPANSVKETTVADVQLNDDGAPSQVNGYRVLNQLGEGTTSKVYHCQDEDGRDYALKILNKSFLKRKREYKKIDGKMVFSNAFQKVQKEVAIMKKLSHDGLVKLYEIIDSPADDKMVLVLELITGGQVMKFEEKGFRYRCLRTTSGVLDPEDVRRCMRNVIDALDYLHKNAICHRDIKPENILLASESNYKLADFGVAHMIEDSADKKTLRNTEGTYHFLAPECTTGNEYDPYMVDIWALGVTMFTLLFGTLPFGTKAASLSDVMDSIRVDYLELDSEAIDEDCEHLLRSMMTKDPNERITIEQLKRHPWLIQGAESCALQEHDEPSPVEVTREEIEAAFTPVNNFILMVRIKMKMAGRLARARNSIDLAKTQSPGSPSEIHKSLQRVEPTEYPTAIPEDALPMIETAVAETTQEKVTDEITTPSPTPSPTSSPGKAAIAMLTRRLSFKSEATVSIDRQYNSIFVGNDGGASPTRGNSTTLMRRKSSLDGQFVIENPTEKSEKNGVGSTSDVSSSSRPPRLQLSADTKLPKLDLITNSPSGSPHASPIRRQLTPRFSRENVMQGWEASDEEADVQPKSPTEKRHRTKKLHQGIVHPAPPPDKIVGEGIVDNSDVAEGSLETITVVPAVASPPIKKKTQDEAKVAISSIIHRTNADTTSPSASPVKEPSVMLQRRKSSNPYPVVPSTEEPAVGQSTLDETAALPRLQDQTGRLRQSGSSSPQEAPNIGFVSKPPGKASGAFVTSRFSPPRGKASERSIRSEKSICSNGRASTYAAECMDSSPLHEDDSGRYSNSTPTVDHSPERVGESPKAPRNRRLKENPLTNCLPSPNETEFVMNPSTHRVHTYASAERHEEDAKPTTPLPMGDKTPPKAFGLFRKTSNNNVAPLELIRDTGIGEENDTIDDASLSKQYSRARAETEKLPPPNSPMTDDAATLPTGAAVGSPTMHDLVGDSFSSRRVFSPRKTVMQSHESIRLLVLQRSQSVKALLTGKKTGLEAADDSLQRNPSLATLPRRVSSVKGPSAAALGMATSPRKPRTASLQSTTCVMQ